MATSVQKPLPPMLLNSVDSARVAASADGQPGSSAVNRHSIQMRAIVKDVLIRHFGSLKAAAITFGMDQGQLSRELDTGDFKLLKRLDGHDDLKLAIARAMVEAFDDHDPKARTRRLLRDVRQRLDDLAEVIA